MCVKFSIFLKIKFIYYVKKYYILKFVWILKDINWDAGVIKHIYRLERNKKRPCSKTEIEKFAKKFLVHRWNLGSRYVFEHKSLHSTLIADVNLFIALKITVFRVLIVVLHIIQSPKIAGMSFFLQYMIGLFIY